MVLSEKLASKNGKIRYVKYREEIFSEKTDLFDTPSEIIKGQEKIVSNFFKKFLS